MTIDVRRITADDAAWLAALQGTRHDVYHLPCYADAIAKHERGHAQLWIASDATTSSKVILPLIVQPVSLDAATHEGGTDHVDASSPYNYGSPLVSTAAERRHVQELWRELERQLHNAGFVSLFLRMNPYLPFPTEQTFSPHEVVHHGRTVAVDLNASVDELWRRIRKRTKPKVNGLHREGFFLRRTDASGIERFEAMYRNHMQRLGASERYFFGVAHFYLLAENCGDAFELYEVIGPTGETVAAAIFLVYDGVANYHLSATHADFVDRSPISLLLWDAIKTFSSRGLRYVHLGGGRGGEEDSLFHFKTGFGKELMPFSTVRLVLNERAYANACAERGITSFDDRAGFFPAYRAKNPSSNGARSGTG